mgnify:CR=1 FL=1
MEVSKMNNKKKIAQKYFVTNEKHGKLAEKLLAACVLASVYAGSTQLPVISIDEILVKAKDTFIQTKINVMTFTDRMLFNTAEAVAYGTQTIAAGSITTDSTVNNGATLTITPGALQKKLSGAGNVIISGGTVSGGTVQVNGILANTGTVTVNSNVMLYVMAANLQSGNITNNGVVKLNSGTVNQIITGGALQINDAQKTGVYADANRLKSNTITFTDSAAILNLTAGTLLKSVTGTGTVKVTGSVASNASYFAANSNQIASGTLTLTAGSLIKSLSGAGTLKIAGNVTATQSGVKISSSYVNVSKADCVLSEDKVIVLPITSSL